MAMEEVEDRLRRLQESINEKYDKIEALEALRDEQNKMLEALVDVVPSDMALTLAELELAGLRNEAGLMNDYCSSIITC